MQDNNTHFWLWLSGALIGGLLLVNLSPKYIGWTIAVLLMGAVVTVTKYGGSLNDLIKTIEGKK